MTARTNEPSPPDDTYPDDEHRRSKKADVPGYTGPAAGGPGDIPTNVPNPIVAEIIQRFPWIPPELIGSFIVGYTEYGNDTQAWEYVRANDPNYDTFFAGNRRDNGTFRYDEAQYMQFMDNFRGTINDMSINPDLFVDLYANLIRDEVSPQEFFTRVNALAERVNNQLPEIQAWYAAAYGLDLTPEAILASAFDEDIGQAILNQQITMAEIGGEAASRDFDIDIDTAQALFEADISRDQAAAIFGSAANALPALNVLASRHMDPDDTFDIHEFLDASVFDDPFQRSRMRRLVAQERAGFAQTGALQMLRDKFGGQTGLSRR